MTFQIYHINTPHYSVSEVSGDVLDAMREALRLENESGIEGWMIRDFRGPKVREYPAFLCRRDR